MQNWGEQEWPRSRSQSLDLHLSNSTDCTEAAAAADSYQGKKQAKHRAPAEAKENCCIRNFTGCLLCLAFVKKGRQKEKCFRPSPGFKPRAYANLEHQRVINVEGAFEDELGCVISPQMEHDRGEPAGCSSLFLCHFPAHRLHTEGEVDPFISDYQIEAS